MLLHASYLIYKHFPWATWCHSVTSTAQHSSIWTKCTMAFPFPRSIPTRYENAPAICLEDVLHCVYIQPFRKPLSSKATHKVRTRKNESVQCKMEQNDAQYATRCELSVLWKYCQRQRPKGKENLRETPTGGKNEQRYQIPVLFIHRRPSVSAVASLFPSVAQFEVGLGEQVWSQCDARTSSSGEAFHSPAGALLAGHWGISNFLFPNITGRNRWWCSVSLLWVLCTRRHVQP